MWRRGAQAGSIQLTQIDSVDKRYFVGLPSPSAAALVAAFVWAVHDIEQTRSIALLTMLVVAGEEFGW